MTNIVVLIKQVPDYENRQLSDDFTLDRAGSDPVLDEINEKAVEVALQLKEKHADAGYNVVVLTAGPSSAESAIRRALSMGAGAYLASKSEREVYESEVARERLEAASQSGRYKSPIVTVIEPAPAFWPAEDYHQRYFEKHGGSCHVSYAEVAGS